MKKSAPVVVALVVLAVAAALFLVRGRGAAARGGEDGGGEKVSRMADAPGASKARHGAAPERESSPSAVPDGAGASGGESFDDGVEAGPEEPLSEEEAREREEERLVEAFDALTDRWMEPSADGVTMADVDAFAQQFKKIPASRREECLHRALNLVPDENVMLLAGILMDKSVEQDLVEAVYNDVLNRDEDVKKPILQQIFKDRTHPCWADTAWILDVTGELPEKK